MNYIAKCMLYSNCGCIPGAYTETIFRNEKTRNIPVTIDPRYMDSQPIEVPIDSNSDEGMGRNEGRNRERY
ncbi:hypothetical protein TKK_0009721 [Trichogramma kaykai]